MSGSKMSNDGMDYVWMQYHLDWKRDYTPEKYASLTRAAMRYLEDRYENECIRHDPLNLKEVKEENVRLKLALIQAYKEMQATLS